MSERFAELPWSLQPYTDPANPSVTHIRRIKMVNDAIRLEVLAWNTTPNTALVLFGNPGRSDAISVPGSAWTGSRAKVKVRWSGRVLAARLTRL